MRKGKKEKKETKEWVSEYLQGMKLHYCVQSQVAHYYHKNAVNMMCKMCIFDWCVLRHDMRKVEMLRDHLEQGRLTVLKVFQKFAEDGSKSNFCSTWSQWSLKKLVFRGAQSISLDATENTHQQGAYMEILLNSSSDTFRISLNHYNRSQ